MGHEKEGARPYGRVARIGKHPNCIGALVLTAALFVPLVLRFDFYYDLNDDVLIKDILSGVYTGAPEGHTMQLLYPLGLLLSLLYRCLSLPVFGVFLALCQFGSIFVIGLCTVRCFFEWGKKVLALAGIGVFFLVSFGWHLVFLQYTVTAGMLAGAAVFRVLTLPEIQGETAGSFLRRNLPALLLYWLAFCLRSEMALLLLPLAAAAGLCRWAREGRMLRPERARKYLLTFAALLLGLFVCYGWDALAYGSGEWKEFKQFFDARTELYDYRQDVIRDYEGNEAAYRSAGVSPRQQALLENYNFGVDDGIDAALLSALNEAAGEGEMGGLFRKSLREGLWDLLYGHWLSRKDLFLNLVFWVALAAAAWRFLKKKRFRPLGLLLLLLIAGGALWLFLLLRDRIVDRVVHPLYLTQILLFFGLWLGTGAPEEEPGKNPSKSRVSLCLLACVLGAVALVGLPFTARTIGQECARRETVNAENQAVMAYCAARQNWLFLEDVYSTVDFSERITVDRQKPFNYDLLGGWLVKSPLTARKLAAFGFSSMGEALRSGGNVFLLCSTQTDMDWLRAYFAEEELPYGVVRTGSAAEGVDLYQVLPVSGIETLE